MTMTQTIDTHRMVEDLRAAGVNKKQAEAHVSTLLQFVELNLATKTDIAKIQHDIENLRLATKTDIENLRKETKTDIENLRKETKTDIENLRSDLTIKMLYLGGGLFLATTGITLGILPLLLR